MLNIATEYPILKGDAEVQMVSLQNTVCSLLDELRVILPQLDERMSNIGGSANTEAEE